MKLMKPVFLFTLFIAAVVGAIGHGYSPVVAANIGVTAAVNKQAKSTLPTGRVRQVVLGNKVIFKERINTSGTGLVQVLFVDGSTVTVGADAELVIDEFIYNPAKGRGKLVVSFGKGVMRFVGGKISKKKDSVSIRTTVGTAGIRGGMANIAVDGQKGIFTFLFGDELIFTGLAGQRRRIYQAGYTLLAERAGRSDYSRLLIRRTKRGEIELFQDQLAGKRGQRGGARRGPTDQSVAFGPVPPLNSQIPLPRVKPMTNPQTVKASPLPTIENDLLDPSNSIDPRTLDMYPYTNPYP